jgi:hypothetical protein
MNVKELIYRATLDKDYERPIREHTRKYPKANRITIIASKKRSQIYHWFTKKTN